jgi:hypothetical protein
MTRTCLTLIASLLVIALAVLITKPKQDVVARSEKVSYSGANPLERGVR